MSDARRNETIARRLWQGASEGDPAPILELDPHVRWCTHGTGPNAGEFVGLDAVIQYLASAGENVDTLRSELIDVYASARGAVIHWRAELRRAGQCFEGEYFLWLRIEDGVIRELVVVPWDQAAVHAFFGLH